MSLVSIRNALETKLNAMAIPLSTAWESVAFVPVVGTPYQRVNIMIADNQDLTLENSTYQVSGIMQVTFCYPPNVGAKTCEARADLLKTHFKCGTKLASGGVDVEIYKTPQIALPIVDGTGYFLPVSIYFKAIIIT